MASNAYAAIGDVHGRFDLLEPLYHRLIGILDSDYPTAVEKRIVFLGDYVDRGPFSKDVLDFLIQKAPDPRHIILPGNHEQLFWEFLVAEDEDELVDASRIWFTNGGLETLRSYLPDNHPIFEERYQDNELVLEEARGVIPEDHKSFLSWILNGKQPFHIDRDTGLFFTHAGINPDKRLEDHRYNEFFWSRHESFLNGKAWVERLKVIHGHTITDRPVSQDNRIGIDTGAFMTGVLSAVIIDDDGEIRFVSETL